MRAGLNDLFWIPSNSGYSAVYLWLVLLFTLEPVDLDFGSAGLSCSLSGVSR